MSCRNGLFYFYPNSFLFVFAEAQLSQKICYMLLQSHDTYQSQWQPISLNQHLFTVVLQYFLLVWGVCTKLGLRTSISPPDPSSNPPSLGRSPNVTWQYWPKHLLLHTHTDINRDPVGSLLTKSPSQANRVSRLDPLSAFLSRGECEERQTAWTPSIVLAGFKG